MKPYVIMCCYPCSVEAATCRYLADWTNDFLERDYSFYGYKGMNGYAYDGSSLKGGKYKTLKKIKSVEDCFRKCAQRSNTCRSFQYDTKKNICKLSKKGFGGGYSDEVEPKYEVKFCMAKKRYVAGWTIDEED